MTFDALWLALGICLVVWNVAQFALAGDRDDFVGLTLGFCGLFCGALLIIISVPGVIA